MTNVEKRKKQYQLEALLARKGKADSLGAEVIAATRETYDSICAQIVQLELELSGDTPMGKLTNLIHEAMAWAWPESADWTICAQVAPDVAKEIARLEAEITKACDGDDTELFDQLLQQYRDALHDFYQVALRPPAQTTLFSNLGFKEVVDNDCPFN